MSRNVSIASLLRTRRLSPRNAFGDLYAQSAAGFAALSGNFDRETFQALFF
jgi:hypothetical protein